MNPKVLLFLKGFLMGVCDIIPGVSGGTIAFITGIYDKLVHSITLFNKDLLKAVLNFDIGTVKKHVPWGFLIPLGSGIAMALISTSRLVHYLLNHHAIYTWSVFTGLILASVVFLSKEIQWKKFENLIIFLIGTLGAYFLVGMIPVQTPESYLFIFFSGCVAISAMILPGISGSFILLLLGKYAYITGALRNPFVGENFTILIFFALGCGVGILAFSRLLDFLLLKYQQAIFSLLTGFILGALRKIWPWKEVLESKVIRGKTHILREANYLPDIGAETTIAIGLMLVAFAIVFGVMIFSKSRGVSSAG
jgi:putative membrane protein